MSGGAADEVTVGTGASQCADTTRSARGETGGDETMLFSHSAMRSHVSGGCHSMKKHGPPPCGKKSVGSFESAIAGLYARYWRGAIGALLKRPQATNAASPPRTRVIGSAWNSPR